MKIIICKNLKKNQDPNCTVVTDIIAKLKSFGMSAEFSSTVHENCDLIITVGGDGTILHHGKAAARLNKPLLGINMGRLGFMTSIELGELDLLERLKNPNINKRMMLDVNIRGEKHLALNDAVFYRGQDSKLPEFTVKSNNHVISEVRADGLIISTPTGSTAYALSAGGPIIEPWLDCIELTTLCAHSLFGRPMIFSADEPLIIRYGDDDKRNVFVTVDGETGIPLGKNEDVIIKRSELRLSLIDLKDGSFHLAVKNKLMKPL
jgi:NAD+ kinase